MKLEQDFRILVGAPYTTGWGSGPDSIAVWTNYPRNMDIVVARGLVRRSEYAKAIITLVDKVYPRLRLSSDAWENAVAYAAWWLE